MTATRGPLLQMARYHGWATRRLLAAIEAMPDSAYRQPCGLFFGSIHGTLNHLLLADSEIWFARLAGRPPLAVPLDAEIERGRGELAARLIAAAEAWPPYLAELDDAALAADLHYTMTTGQARVLPMETVLLHVFNHATHHRGQITAAMTMLGHDFPPLDLPYMVFGDRESAPATKPCRTGPSRG